VPKSVLVSSYIIESHVTTMLCVALWSSSSLFVDVCYRENVSYTSYLLSWGVCQDEAREHGFRLGVFPLVVTGLSLDVDDSIL